MAERGFEGSEMAGTFNMLRANDLIWSFVVNNYLMGKDPSPSTCCTGTRTPPACRRRCTASTCATCTSATCSRSRVASRRRQDRHLQGQDACYFISTIEDHIAPWKSTYGCPPAVGRTKFVLGGSGHIAGIVNPPAANKYGYWTNDATANLPESPDDFRRDAAAGSVDRLAPG
jgi:polyhydroxyalkanoate synthase